MVGVTDVGRQGVATAKELDRIKKEKEELIKRMQALTTRETTLDTGGDYPGALR